MGKHTDKLGSIENFKAPWETESGEDAEIDKSKLKRLIFNLKSGEAKALDSVEEAKESIAETDAENDKLKADLEKASGPEAQKRIDKLETENKALKDAAKAREEADAEAALRKEVLGDFAEKHPKAAKYVVGKTEEELEKSLAEIKADFGIEDEGNESGEDDDLDEIVGRTTPKPNLRTGGDPNPGTGGSGEIDFDKVADEIIGAGRVFG